MMVGSDNGEILKDWRKSEKGEKRINIRGMREGMEKNVDMDENEGEIIGIGGMVGKGKEDFMMGIYGEMKKEESEEIV